MNLFPFTVMIINRTAIALFLARRSNYKESNTTVRVVLHDKPQAIEQKVSKFFFFFFVISLIPVFFTYNCKALLFFTASTCVVVTVHFIL